MYTGRSTGCRRNPGKKMWSSARPTTTIDRTTPQARKKEMTTSERRRRPGRFRPCQNPRAQILRLKNTP
jgi:hypothetical protein